MGGGLGEFSGGRSPAGKKYDSGHLTKLIMINSSNEALISVVRRGQHRVRGN